MQHQPAQHLHRACSRPSRTSRRCTASSWRSPQGRKGPARGGVLDGDEAQALRALIAEHGAGARAGRARAGARACAAAAAQSDRGRARVVGGADQRPALRRPAASSGRCRSAPHIADFVSFPLRCVIDLVPPSEAGRGRRRRAPNKRALARPSATTSVVEVQAADVEADVSALDELAALAISQRHHRRPKRRDQVIQHSKNALEDGWPRQARP